MQSMVVYMVSSTYEFKRGGEKVTNLESLEKLEKAFRSFTLVINLRVVVFVRHE